MALRYVLDEHLRGLLWNAIRHHNSAGINPIDVARVGDPADLPRGTKDPSLLLWAEREDRVVVSLDRRTMPGHLSSHLAAGRHSPGIIILDPSYSLGELVFYLVLTAYACGPDELRDQVIGLP